MGIQEEIVNTILKVNMRTVLLDIMLMRSEFHLKKKDRIWSCSSGGPQTLDSPLPQVKD